MTLEHFYQFCIEFELWTLVEDVSDDGDGVWKLTELGEKAFDWINNVL